MKIKICGLKRKKDADYVNQCEPDYAGFVFAGKKRRIDYDTAAFLKSRLSPGIRSVGVFVNEDQNKILNLVRDRIIDIIQLHGDEDEQYIIMLKQKLSEHNLNDIPIIKAVRVQSEDQVIEAEKLPVDYLLLDAFSKDEYGGSGVTFKHEMIPKLCKPYMLAGGIDSVNVIEILNNISSKNVTLPFCIDVSSSVETDGNKDLNKIKEMIDIVRRI